MIEELKRLLKHSGIFGIGVMLSKSVGFFMIPVYTHYLTPADYGIMELLDLVVFFTAMFAASGIHGAVFRFYAMYDDPRDKKEVVSSGMFYYALASALFSVALFLASDRVAWLVLGTHDGGLVRIVAGTFFFSSLSEVPLAYYRAEHRSGLFVAIGLARTILGVGTLAFFLVGMKWGLRGALYANLLTNALAGVALTAAVLPDLPLRVAREKLGEMLRYGVPLIAQSLASFVLIFSDRFFLRRFSTLGDVGTYSLGYKLAGVVSLLVTGPFTFAWQWQQFELAKREDGKQIQSKIQTYQLMVSLWIAVAVSVLAFDALRIMSPASYWPAARVVPLLALSYVLANVRVVVSSGILVQKVTDQLAVISVIVAGSTLALNYLLIPRFASMGAAVATVLAFAISLGLNFTAAQRVHYVRFEYGRNAVLLGLAALVYLASTLRQLPLLPSIAVNTLLVGVFGAVSIAVLDREERAMLWNVVTAAVNKLRLMATPAAQPVHKAASIE